MTGEICKAAERLARELHADPEVGLEEARAAERCCRLLEDWNFNVERGIAGLPTAFVGTCLLGNGDGPCVAVLTEYDALPEVGHACGHNLIAGGTLEAAGRLAQQQHLNGVVKCFGTPAEEIFAGKGPILRAGLLNGVDAVLAYHPWDDDGVFSHFNGVAIIDLTFHGRPAHAASTPWDGRSAQDAVTLASHALALERQYVRDGSRIHALITESSGSHNVFSDVARLRINLRGRTSGTMAAMRRRVEEIAEGVARATNTTHEFSVYASAEPYRYDERLGALALGIMGLPPGAKHEVGGSSDISDVSQALPTVCVTLKGWSDRVGWHSRELAERTGSASAYASMHRAADVLTACGTRILEGTVPA